MGSKVIAIVGSYRKGGVTDAAVQALLVGAREKGAETSTIWLIDRPIGFCTNCRQCMQTPGGKRGRCVQQDGLEPLLEEIESADSLVFASPVNFGNTTAIFPRFLERSAGWGYWPWGENAPKGRIQKHTRKAVLVATSAMPGFLIPIATGTGAALRKAAEVLSVKIVGKLWIGLAAGEPNHTLTPAQKDRARRLGWKLA